MKKSNEKLNYQINSKLQSKYSITLVALFLVLAMTTLMLVGCEESSSSSSSGGGGNSVTPTLASLSNVWIQAASNDGTLSLRWEAPSEATHVVVKAISTTPAQSIQVRVPAIEYRTLFQQDKPYMLRGLYAITDYTVEIEAQKSDSGSASEVSPKTIHSVTTLTDETAPQDTFTRLAVTKAQNDSIKITWDKALLSLGKTDIAEAIIQVIESTTNVKKEVTVQDVTQGEVTIAVPTIDGISYDVTVVYRDSNGNESTAKQVLRGIVPSALSQTVAALPEADLTVTANDKSNSPADESLLIQWGNNFDFSTGKSLQVRVIATATNTLIAYETVSNSSTAKLSSASADNQEYATVYVAKDGIALTKLYGTLTYKVEVYVSKNGKYSTAVSKEQATTDKSTEPVSNVSAIGGADSIVVGWQAPDVRDYAGVTITVTEKNSPAKTVTITERTLRNTQITGLKATTEYSIAVQSQDYTGNKGAKITATTTTVDDGTAPDAVTNIQASYPFVSPTKIGTQITWTAPDTTKANNKDIKEYSISIAEKDTSTSVLSEKKIPYPTKSLSVEELTQGKTYTITIQAIDYAGNKSSQATKDITTPQPTAPSEDLFQNKPSLDTTGAIQIKATFKQAPGIGSYYTLRMYDGATLVAEKSITGSVTAITFGIADGLEVPKVQANAKNYRFTFLTIANNIVSPVTTLADTVAVYDSTSTAPPAAKDAKLSVESVTQVTATAVYTFSAGDITDTNKAPNGNKLEQAQIQYKVYIAEGDHSTKTLEAIKGLAGVQTQNIAGDSTLQVRFIGKKAATYTAGVEAINSLNPSYSIGLSATIKTAILTAPPSTPKVTTYTTNNAVVFAVPTTGSNSGKKVITVQVNASDIAGVSKADSTPLAATDLAYYVLYLKKEDTTGKPASVSALWAIEKSSVKVAKYTKAAGTTQDTISIPIVDSTSGSNAGATPIETAKDYYIGVRIVNTTSSNYDATNSDKLFPAGFYTDVTEIKEVYTSKAVAPNQSLLAGKLVVSPSTNTAGTIKLVLTELKTFTGAKDYDGTSITASNQLVYTVYGLQKATTPTVAEVLSGRKINIGSASSGVYTVPALSSLGLSSDADPVIAVKGATKYYFVVEVAVKTDPSKKVASSTVASVTTASQATAPAEVSSIQTIVAQTGMRVSWTAPSLSASHKANTGDTLTVAQVSYKVYKVAKDGSARSVAAIKNADSSPTTVAAGTTNTTLTGLTNGTTYEIVVQAVNSTDDTKISTGERHEFEARAISIGNTTVVSAEVGKTPAINITRVLTSNSAFTCDTNILEADAKKIKKETGLAVSFNQSSKTVTITGIANKSNIHDPSITEYSYTVVQCTFTASKKKVPATIVIQTELRTAPSGKAATYYRSTTNSQLKTIIREEKTRQATAGQSNNPSPNLNMVDTSAMTDMNSLFEDDSTFNGDITQWNVSNVTNMTSMFWGASVFNQNIGDWDTGKVVSMGNMFIDASAFNQNIGSWDVSKVTSMISMFDAAIAFDQNIGNWNVSKVTEMQGMFARASAFNQNIGNWNVSKVAKASYMFNDASAFDQDLSSWKWCKIRKINFDEFSGSAMSGKTSKYPKIKGSAACSS